MDAPETVTDAVALLRKQGYVDDCEVRGSDVCVTNGDTPRGEPEMRVAYRFEGPSDPADEMIVIGVVWPGGRKGVLVSAYGPDVSPEEAATLARLVDDRP